MRALVLGLLKKRAFNNSYSDPDLLHYDGNLIKLQVSVNMETKVQPEKGENE